MSWNPPPIVLTAGRLDPTGATGLALDAAFLARLSVRSAPVVAVIAVERTLGERPGRAVDAATFADQVRAAREALGENLSVVHAGVLAGESQAEVLAETARALGRPLVAELGWRPSGPLGAFDAASLVVADIDSAARVTGRSPRSLPEGLLGLARALAGPARTAAVFDDAAAGGVSEMAISGPAGEASLETAPCPSTAVRGLCGARSIVAAGYVALGLPPAEAAASAHRLVAAALAAGPSAAERTPVPDPWRV